MRREEVAPSLPHGQCELTEKVHLYRTEDIAGCVVRDIVVLPEQIERQGFHLLSLRELVVHVLRQDAFKLGRVFLNGFHCLLKRLCDVLVFRNIQQAAVAGMVGRIEATLGHGNIVNGLFPTTAFQLFELGFDGLFMPVVIDVGELHPFPCIQDTRPTSADRNTNVRVIGILSNPTNKIVAYRPWHLMGDFRQGQGYCEWLILAAYYC